MLMACSDFVVVVLAEVLSLLLHSTSLALTQATFSHCLDSCLGHSSTDSENGLLLASCDIARGLSRLMGVIIDTHRPTYSFVHPWRPTLHAISSVSDAYRVGSAQRHVDPPSVSWKSHTWALRQPPSGESTSRGASCLLCICTI
ncbi:hypothetical protein CALVIDRAFT_82122 [Calocera viscosa TUFC12733]|uniref:Secreted protein n=1 Tax=Calocera viscosa (strain TUFC12733) TaxID=1330018 RepID=A0A167N1R4_CALVF|nr:hypothetical protein CALVIDRAFT_82122 [Calocera viscosa TUFC12733]